MPSLMIFRQLQQPQTLQDLAKSRIVEWITSHVEVNEDIFSYVPDLDTKETEKITQNIKIVRDYLENILGVFARDLFESLKNRLILMPHLDDHFQSLEDLNLCPSERLYATVRWIEVLFTKYVNFLYLNSQTTSIFKTSLTTQMYLLTGLTELHIFEYLIPNSEEESIKCSDYTEIFKRIPNLKHLKLDCRSDKFLRCVIDNCKSLVTIDLFAYFNMGTESLDELIKLPNLKTVHLYDSFDEYLFYPPDQIEEKKKELWKYTTLHKQFRMKLFIITNGVTDEDLQIVKSYPMIERVEYFDTVGDFVPRRLDNLKYLECVRELKVYGHNFYKHQVVELLEILGKNVKNLQLSNVNRIDIQALLTICVLCPNLQVLTLRLNRFYPTSLKPIIFKYRAILRDNLKLDTQFNNLHTFNLTVGLEEDGFLSTSVLQKELNQFITILLLHICPNVQYLDLTLAYSDDFLLKVLNRNPLKDLKELRIANLTQLRIRKLHKRVIDQIVQNCSSAEVVLHNYVENIRS